MLIYKPKDKTHKTIINIFSHRHLKFRIQYAYFYTDIKLKSLTLRDENKLAFSVSGDENIWTQEKARNKKECGEN
jgi:hypothetical protein